MNQEQNLTILGTWSKSRQEFRSKNDQMILFYQEIECTLRIAGAIELGPLDEKYATFGNTGLPTIVLESLNFTSGDLRITVTNREDLG